MTQQAALGASSSGGGVASLELAEEAGPAAHYSQSCTGYGAISEVAKSNPTLASPLLR
jgi:hypothetical protein